MRRLTGTAARRWSEPTGAAVAPLWRTADWGYLRLHAGGGEAVWPYAGGPRDWAVRLAETWHDRERRCAVYTQQRLRGGAALRDAVDARRAAARGRP